MSDTPIPETLHQQAAQRLLDCMQQADRYFGKKHPQPTLNYRLRGKTAGKALLDRWEIRLNPILFEENQSEFLAQVIPHEVAHLLVYRYFGRVRPHGEAWQNVMQTVFHCPPQTTHTFDIQSVQGRTFPYRCACQTHALSMRRHGNVIRRQVAYHCKSCRQPLVWET